MVHIATESHFIGINFIQDGFLGSHIDKSKVTQKLDYILLICVH